MQVSILGAGIIGLACANELMRRGHTVTVFDPEPGNGASHAAAGMLSPAGEAWFGEEPSFDLACESLTLWPDFAAPLDVPVHTSGTLVVGADVGDSALVERHASVLAGHGMSVEILDRRAVRAADPALGPAVTCGALLPRDHSVDPRAVLSALLRRVPVTRESGTSAHWHRGDATVIATGWQLPAPFQHLVHGVRGEIVRARLTSGAPRHTIRGWIRGRPAYVVARPDGEVVIGATSEVHAGKPPVTLGGMHELLDTARELVPALDRATFTEATARNRPATPDQLPLIGPTEFPGVVLAAGHHRNGVLLTPLTAHLVANHLESGRVDPRVDPRRLGGLACTSA